MRAKLTKRWPVLVLPLAVLLCMGLWLISDTNPSKVIVDSDTGVYDLRDADLARRHSVSRTVEYVPGVLLTPQEFALRDDILVGTVPEDLMVVTMRIRFLVPDGIQYGMCGYSTNQAGRVYVNGKWLFDEGAPAYTAEEEESGELYYLFSAQPQGGEIEIVVATSSFSHLDTSSGMEWSIGEYHVVKTSYARYTLVHIVVTGWYVLLALIFFLLFLTLPAYSANGWLALMSLVSALRTGITGTKPLMDLIPSFDWGTGYRIEKFAGPLLFTLLLFMLNSVFTDALPAWLRRVSVGLVAVVGAMAVFLPTRTLSGFSGMLGVFNNLVVSVAGVFILLSLRRKRPDLPQKIVLAGMALVVFATVWDQSYYRGNWFGLPFSILQPIVVVFSLFMLAATMIATIQKNSEAENEAAELRIEVLEQETEMTKARTATALSQIQPHFLYNSLAVIQNLCVENPTQAEEAVGELALFLRGNVDSLAQKDLIPFTEELSLVQNYLSLEKKQFYDALEVRYELDTTDFCVPPLTVQPIVENAVKHGVGRLKNGGVIVVATGETATYWQITVQDNGPGFDPEAAMQDGRSHVGMDNVRTRLKIMCDGTLEYESSPGAGTTATIQIPKPDTL